MSILNKRSQESNDRNKIVIEEQEKERLRLLSTTRLKPGQSVFAFELETGILRTLTDDDYTDIEVDVSRGKDLRTVKKRLKYQEGVVYQVALNMKNAVRKLKKRGIPIGERID